MPMPRAPQPLRAKRQWSGLAALLALSLAAACTPPATTVAPPPATPTARPAPATPTFTTTVPPATATPAASPTPARSALVSEFQHEVNVHLSEALDWQTAFIGQTLAVGGGARTGPEARARLDLSDGPIIRLASSSEFVLRQLATEGGDPVTRFMLTAGQVWVAVLGELGNGLFEIETPTGVATVRGSYLSVAYTPETGRTLVTCLEGACRLTSSDGQSTDLTGGQQAEIAGQGQAPSAAQPMRLAQYIEWSTGFPEAPPELTTLTSAAPAAPGAVPRATATRVTPQTTPALAGTWTGLIRGEDFESELVLTIAAGCGLGQVCGTYAAAAPGCAGELVLAAASADTFVLTEQTQPTLACPSGGVETLRLRPDGALDWSFRYVTAASVLSSSGVLQRP